MLSRIPLLLTVALAWSPGIAAASEDGRFAARLDEASAVFYGVGRGETLEITEVLKGDPDEPVEAAGVPVGYELLVVANAEVVVFSPADPEYQTARAVLQFLDPEANPILDFEALLGCGEGSSGCGGEGSGCDSATSGCEGSGCATGGRIPAYPFGRLMMLATALTLLVVRRRD